MVCDKQVPSNPEHSNHIFFLSVNAIWSLETVHVLVARLYAVEGVDCSFYHVYLRNAPTETDEIFGIYVTQVLLANRVSHFSVVLQSTNNSFGR